MATFEITITSSKVSFNVNAVTFNQASDKAFSFIADYPELNTNLCKPLEILVIKSKGDCPKITMTSYGYSGRYKVNPNTNKKAIETLLQLTKESLEL